MRRSRVGLQRVLLAAGLSALSAGCFGGTQNPSRFPFLLPTGDVVPTHAKPPGVGYFSDFDRHACRVEVRPQDGCVPVRSQQVLLATVYDENDKPRRKRRVEWIVEGPGTIIEVDESGYLPGRGYKVDNKYAVSYTDYFEHTITRGNHDPSDDFTVRPGQTWCVLTSAVEGQTTVTVYAPEVHDWGRGRAFVKLQFVDAACQFPPAVSVRSGAPYTFATKVYRHTDNQPLPGYRVRYRLLDGPPAVLTAGGAAKPASQEEIAVTGADGFARVSVRQAEPRFGSSRVAVEVLRPAADGSGETVVDRSETRIDWEAPRLNVSVDAPKLAQLNQTVPVTITVASTGPVEAQPVMLKLTLPPGVELVGSSERQTRDGDAVLWKLPVLPAGTQHAVRAELRPTKLGPANLAVVVPTADGQRVEESAAVQVAEAKLEMKLSGPATAVAGETLPVRVTVTNPGSGPAANVKVTARYDDGLALASTPDPLEQRIPELGPGETRSVTLPLVPAKAGRLSVRTTAQADGNLAVQAQPYQVEVAQPRLTVQVTGPARGFLNQEVTWTIRVSNLGAVPLNNVTLRAELPGEVDFRRATDGGTLTKDQVVVWKLDTAPAQQTKEVQVTGVCAKLADRALLSADVTAEPLVNREGTFRVASMARPFGAEKPAEASLEILGVPALQLNVSESSDPAEVGQRLTYTVQVRNTGTLAGNGVELTADLPPELRPLSASGPAAGKVTGQRVTFAALDGVQPGRSATYTIQAEVLSAGDARFRAELRALSMNSPIRVEEPTHILPRGTTVPVPKPAPR